MILIKDLSVSYNKKENVIEGLSLQLQKNNIHGIVGLNGAGKTTLLNTIFGLKKQNRGEILWNGEKLTKKSIAFLPAENYFYPHITGREYLNIFKNKSFDIENWNKLFILPLDKLTESYSTGMKKKLALFAVLKKDKPVMLLDEPFISLDIETERIVRSVLLKLKDKGKTIVITSHVLERLTSLCDDIHYLENGKIRLSVEKDQFDAFRDKIYNSIENKNKKLIDELMK